MTNQQRTLFEKAVILKQAGISVVATGEDKLPVGKWGHLQQQIASIDELKSMFTHARATEIALIGGLVSGNLYNMDFEGKDHQGSPMTSVYPQWAQLVKAELQRCGYPDLFDLLVIAKTINDGIHVRWRAEIARKLKTQPLAKCLAKNPQTGELLTDERGKPITNLLIESKAEGGLALCPPSPGYELIQGDLTQIPTVPLKVHNLLVAVARSFHAVPNDAPSKSHQASAREDTTELRPGDDFNQRGDHGPLLEADGWLLDHVHAEVEYWRRPGKDFGWSATWGYIPDRLYVFSSNTSPFEENRTYDRFSIYTLLRHNGDFESAARDLSQQGYGENRQPNHRRRTGQSTSDESANATDESQRFDSISKQIEQAAEITDALERNSQAKAIIDQLVDLAPLDQSLFIDKMKEAKLGGKTKLEAQLNEAIRAKDEGDIPHGIPTDFSLLDDEIRSSFGVYEGSTHYFKLVFDRNIGTYYPKPISSFIIAPTMRVKLDGYDMFRVDYITETKPITGGVMHRKDFNDKMRFKDALKSAALQFFGSDNETQAILGIINQHDVVTKDGTSQLGRHKGVWVLPDGVLNASGWMEAPDLVYVPCNGRGELDDQIAYPGLDEGEYTDFLASVYTNLLDLNAPTVMIPMISWFWATPFKPLFSRFDGFPHLSVWGTRGSGKSTLLRLMWRLFGFSGGKLFSCTETDFVMLKLLSSTTSIPIIFDEYKPYDMQPQRLKALTRVLRKSYDGEKGFRGRADQTTIEYSLSAPIAIAGEVALTEGSLLERIIPVEMSPNTLTPGMRQAEKALKGLPLQAFCSRYIPFTLRTDFEAEKSAAEAMIRKVIDLDALPDRVQKNLIVMVFGFRQFWRFGVEEGVLSAADNVMPLLAQAVHAVQNDVCGEDGVTKVALDYLIEHLAVMAETGRLKYKRDYTIRESYGDIAIRFDSCLAEFRKYARETQLDGEILNAQAYRKQIKENHERGGYVGETTTLVKFGTTPKRVVIIDQKRAEAVNMDLAGFFGNDSDI